MTGDPREIPRSEYSRRLALRRDAAAHWGRLDRVLSNTRLAVFGVGALIAWFVLAMKSLAFAWLGPPVLIFLVLLFVHDRVIGARERADRAVAFYELALARIEHRFAGLGVAGERFRDPLHPYAEDLDLFGAGSLFELLCTARTSQGEDTLAGWLLAPSAPATVVARQAAVEELQPGLDLREDLSLLGADVRAGLHAETLRAWGEAPPVLNSGSLPLVAALLSGLSVLALAAGFLTSIGFIPFLAALAVQGLFARTLRERVQQVIRAVDAPARDLALFAQILARLEQERFLAPRLVELRNTLDTEGVAPSRRIAALGLRVELLDARRNQFFAPIGALLLWTTQLALALERWRAVCGPALGHWIEAVGEIEALSSLGGYAYEHPDHPMPEVIDGGAGMEAEALGHPLIPPEACVRNDLRLGDELRVLVVSGSNMSGKSTMLRTVGTNAVLAQAGAPVCADRLRITPLAVGASIRVQDSLQEGSSRFYAEIKRLRQIMQLAERDLPVLFLLDEILHGTNSHDRGIGAEAVVTGLLERKAIGLVTTHDLALAKVADALSPRATNVHFQDHIEDGKVVFDFRMQPGVVTKSNALELMRSVGLDV